MFLVDSNVWLERLLDQAKSEDVGRFLDNTPSDLLFITDFTFHSIGIILYRLNQLYTLSQFVQDAFIRGAVSLIHLEPTDTPRLIEIMKTFDLDFDDAYQYVAAEKENLGLVSFDGDFDRTKQGRMTPAEVTAT